MKHLAISVSVLSIAVAAGAQTPPLPPPPASSWVNDVLPEGASKPAAEGLHNCLSAYPAKEQAAHVEGITSLGYRIGEDGSVKAVKITKSSGNAALDKAAVACVKGWRYQPAILDQKPIEISWRNDVKWVIEVSPVIAWQPPVPPPSYAPPPPPPPVFGIPGQKSAANPPTMQAPSSVGQPHVCLADYPPDAVAERVQGTTTVWFVITPDGTVEGNRVIKSSGYAALDDASVACSTRWRYRPAIKDGQPVAVPWRAEVKWVMH